MPSDTRREVAERIAGFSLVAFYQNGDAVIDQLKADIEAALKARDERAAGIADNHHPCQDGCYCGSDIADSIRNEES